MLRGVVAVALTGALSVGAARATSRSFVFRGAGAASVQATVTSPDMRSLAFTASDGAPVHALELAGPAGARTFVHFHDNRQTVEDASPLARALGSRGHGVMLVEYRGYGASAKSGDPSEAGVYLDAEAALDALCARGIGPDRVVLSGASLGTGIAVEMARRGRGAALLLVSPYTSLPDVVSDATWGLLPSRLVLADSFDTVDKLGSVRVPTLVVHGDADDIVPFWMGERVARGIAGARLLRIPGGRHGDLFAREGATLFAAISDFARGS